MKNYGLILILIVVVSLWTSDIECYSRPFMLTSNGGGNMGSSHGYKRSEFESCHLRLDHTPALMSGSMTYTTIDSLGGDTVDDANSEDDVYAGNGHSYSINCHVSDPKMRAGDKYYVIDLIVYGPNQRVAKAWREQFTTASLISNGKSFFINKNLSFYSLGENNIICGVSFCFMNYLTQRLINFGQFVLDNT